MVFPTPAGVQSAAQAAGQNIAALMGYYDDLQNLNYVGIVTPSDEYAGYQLFAEGEDAFYAAFFGRILTMRLVSLHGLLLVGQFGWGGGGDRTFLQVWVPRKASLAGTGQDLYCATSFPDLEAWLVSHPHLRLDLLLAYAEGDEDRFLAIFSRSTGQFSDLICTTYWGAFTARLQANAAYALVDFKVYDSWGIRYYLGVWNGPAAPGTQTEFGVTLQPFNQFLGPSPLLTVCGDTYRSWPRYPLVSWTKRVPAAITAMNSNPGPMGGAWAVGYRGNLLDFGSFGYARSPYEPQNPGQAFTIDSRLFVWSLTKIVTTAALLRVLWAVDPTLRKLDQPFLPDAQPMFPSGFVPAAGVANITIRQLLNYTSGINGSYSFPANNPTTTVGSPSFVYADWVAQLLEQPLLSLPGSTAIYYNAPFDIAAFLIGVYSGQPPVQYLVNTFLPQLGVDISGFGYTDQPATDALAYNDQTDTNPGAEWIAVGATSTIGGAGAYASARQLLNFLMGLRSSAYPPGLLQLMITGNAGPTTPEGPSGGPLGWDLFGGVFGEYLWKNGLGSWGQNQAISNGMMHLSDGYDAVLMLNSHGDGVDPIIAAFEY